MIISRIRKINKLFEYKYDSVSLKKIKGISRHIIQLVTYNTDKISKLINSQIDYIIEQVKLKTITNQSCENEIFLIIINDSNLNDNFSNILDIIDYFKKEEETNKSIKEISKISEVSVLTMPISKKNLLLSADLKDYIKMLMGSLDDETNNWSTLYENLARIRKEKVNEVKESPRVQLDDDVYFNKKVDYDFAFHLVKKNE